MSAVLTMTLPHSQSSRSPSPPFNNYSQRNSVVSSATSFHTAPTNQTGHASRSSLNSSSRSSSAHTLSALTTLGTDPINSIHVLSQNGPQNGNLPDDEVHVLRVGPHSVKVRPGPPPVSRYSKVGNPLSQMGDAQRRAAPDRPPPPLPPPPPTPGEPASTQDCEYITTSQSKSEVKHTLPPARKIPVRSGTVDSAPSTRRAASTDTGVSFQSPVRSTSGSLSITQRIPRVGVESRLDDRPPVQLDDDDLSPSSSNPTKSHLSADAYLHPSSAAAIPSRHRPTRRNTTGSSVAQPLAHSSRPLAGSHRHMSAQPNIVFPGPLDSDILEQADQIRRERLSKRARAQQEAEAALTRAHDKKSTIDEKEVLVGNLIGEDHVNYVLMYNMLTGIRIGVSRCQAKIKRPLTDDDFAARHKFSFDMCVACFWMVPSG